MRACSQILLRWLFFGLLTLVVLFLVLILIVIVFLLVVVILVVFTFLLFLLLWNLNLCDGCIGVNAEIPGHHTVNLRHEEGWVRDIEAVLHGRGLEEHTGGVL